MTNPDLNLKKQDSASPEAIYDKTNEIYNSIQENLRLISNHLLKDLPEDNNYTDGNSGFSKIFGKRIGDAKEYAEAETDRIETEIDKTVSDTYPGKVKPNLDQEQLNIVKRTLVSQLGYFKSLKIAAKNCNLDEKLDPKPLVYTEDMKTRHLQLDSDVSRIKKLIELRELQLKSHVTDQELSRLNLLESEERNRDNAISGSLNKRALDISDDNPLEGPSKRPRIADDTSVVAGPSNRPVSNNPIVIKDTPSPTDTSNSPIVIEDTPSPIGPSNKPVSDEPIATPNTSRILNQIMGGANPFSKKGKEKETLSSPTEFVSEIEQTEPSSIFDLDPD